MRKIKYLIFALFLFNMSCNSLREKQLIGTYLQDYDKNTMLIFNQNDFVIKEKYKQVDAPPFSCCDTTTIGVWSLLSKSKVVSIDNSSYFNKMIDIKVIEKNTSPKDSIFIYLNNSIEEIYKKNRTRRDISYYIEFDSDNTEFGLLSSAMYDTNVIKLFNPHHYNINSLQIYVHPKFNFSGRNIAERFFVTQEYNIKNEGANRFIINIPDLTYEYMSYIRLKKDFIRIINKNKLEWDGEIYTKQ